MGWMVMRSLTFGHVVYQNDLQFIYSMLLLIEKQICVLSQCRQYTLGPKIYFLYIVNYS